MRTSATTQAERVAAGPRRRSAAPDDAGASPRPDVSTSPTPGPAPRRAVALGGGRGGMGVLGQVREDCAALWISSDFALLSKRSGLSHIRFHEPLFEVH